ncbi:MAG: tetratricopeptide repeat protein [Comamonadaceae bacterium]|nr:tetratricopeptide repeat protein [Comamonadaceae bacterium]
MEKLQRATQLLPENAQAWNHLGMAYQGTQQLDLAVQAYLQALKLIDIGRSSIQSGVFAAGPESSGGSPE